MRRGLELGGWWPYALAIADAAFAAVIIAALALTMVVGVQAFDTLAVHGGGKPVLPLDTLLNGIASHPSLPEYWWLYALLLSSMIPSLVNLVIGGTSLLRGLPGLPSLLLRKIPTQGNVPKFDRAWIATVLTAQVAAGTALGIAAQATLVVLIRLRHAVLRPGIARHGARRCRVQPAGASGRAVRGQPVASASPMDIPLTTGT